jgi:hypothetical protein
MDRDQTTPKETDRERFKKQQEGKEKKELSKNFGIYVLWHHIAIVVPF